ncbi:PspC domain-containing protein [Niveispirillum lacus]|uniref:PspC domain-containing protein n=1 Tax=Niveispirillum lacus TaxID=1981099 RepID=UPI001A9C8F06|nr:PspC domain-containing protein [Niveispirillum lacus]
MSRYNRHFDRFTSRFQGGKLYKDSTNGILFGVCAGVAEWLGISRFWVRVAAVLSMIFLGGTPILAYFVAALVLSNRPTAAKYDRYTRAFGEDYREWRR